MTARPDTSETISRNVRRLRMARGWTQEEAGRRFGEIAGTPWSKAVWSLAEAQTRSRDWKANELAALTRLFAVTYDDLFATAEPIPTCPACGQEVTP